MIVSIFNTKPYKELFPPDENGREINIYKLENISTSTNTFYPNCLFHNRVNIFNPSSEMVMSLNIETKTEDVCNKLTEMKYFISIPMFYFVYNTDNYYHFVYDTLPYLISYLELRKKFPKMRLLMNYPNSYKKEFYKFVIEFLELLDINEENIEIVNENTVYKNIYISSSYTHGINSNLPPRQEIYGFFKKIVEIAKEKSNIDISSLPKKIYVSR